MKIYHNANCSKSCGALNLLLQNGIKPQVVEYLQNVPTKEELRGILAMLNMKPTDIVRKNEPVFQANYMGRNFNDEQWLDILLQHPELIERPIIVHKGKAIIARPIERVLDLL